MGGHLPPGDIVRPDREIAVARAMRAPDDHGAVAVCHCVENRALIRLADDDDAIGPPGANEGVEPVVALRQHAREQQVIAALGQFVGQKAEHRHEEGVGEMLAAFMPQWQQHRDRPGAAKAEILRGNVEAEAMMVGQRLYAAAGFGVERALGRQRARHGGDRDARDPREIGNAADRACLFVCHAALSRQSGGRRQSIAAWIRSEPDDRAR